ncbi:MAG: response regulator [Candidatus Bipolaricaulia bacterium]
MDSEGVKEIKVLLADDHAVVRQGIRALLEREDGVEVVAEAETGQQAVSEAEAHRPNVAILDISMPLLNGLEAARRILALLPETRIILLSVYDDDVFVREAIRIGVRGYLLKRDSGAELTTALQRVIAGDRFFSSALHVGITERDGPGEPAPGYDALTSREREVLQLIAEGYANDRIAEILCRSVETVRNHRANLMRKLDLHNAAELVKFAQRAGIIRLDERLGIDEVGKQEWEKERGG